MGDNTTEEKVSLKLLVNKETNKVLFAEAGKDFVDVLFSFLTLPLGTIARLAQKDSMIGPVTIGCLNTLHQSVADLDEGCLRAKKSKGFLLQPKNSSEDYCKTVKLNIDDTQPTEYFTCENFDTRLCRCFESSTPFIYYTCCECGKALNRPVSVEPFYEGFTNRVANFVVTDNLKVISNASHYTSLALVQNSGIKSISSVKEITINVTKEKVLDLLKCSFLSKSPMTDVFLAKKPSLERPLFLSTVCANYDNVNITLNLVIRKSDEKILYAQGEQDFADILLSFLTFPLGSIVRVLEENSSLGSIDTLYRSVVNLDENKYFVSKEAKNRLVDPSVAMQFNSCKLILARLKDDTRYYFYHQYENCKPSLINDQCFISNEFKNDWKIDREVQLVYTDSATGGHNGFVKGPVMYVVTDDLILAPSSPISSLYLINRFETPLNDVKEKVVTIGINECMSILKASLTSTSALTNGLRHLITDVKEEK